MRSTSRLLSALAAVVSFSPFAFSQSSTPETFTGAGTGIVFNSWGIVNGGSQTQGGLKFGVALPSDGLAVDASEFIGYLQCSSKDATNTGWCGIPLGGPMTNSLLLTAWPNKDAIYTSFRYATGYAMPDVYTGNAKLTQIKSTINATYYTLVFRCQNCLQWNQGGQTGAFPSPGNPTCPAQIEIAQHDNGMGNFGAVLNTKAANPPYSAWAVKATATVTSTCSDPVQTGVVSVPVPAGTPFDYVVVGGGAVGIPIADKLGESRKKVLLIEKGVASSGRWGSTLKPSWLVSTNLTRFDVPGLCNQIWVDSAGIACTDTDQMAGCVLGGGTAVNAGLWFKPYSLDWDYLFPTGWKSADVAAAVSRVFSRIPGTDMPSQDGKRYQQEGFNVLAGGLKSAGWSEVTANNSPNLKNRTYAHTPYMYSGGERGSLMATYLVSATKRNNFNLWLNTAVKRVIREDGHITGVEVEAFRDGGYSGIVNVTTTSGRVVLSAGTFDSAKILLRSGIGPQDQLEVVKSSADGPTMIGNGPWINLPVGRNLDDHVNTDTVITHPDVRFYDFYEAWTAPNTTDTGNYLSRRTGILSQAAPNIGPLFWGEIKGADGIVRQLQWTARVEGSFDTPNGFSMTMSQYLGRGATSRGRMTITPSLSTVVSDAPYLKDANDEAAVIQGLVYVQNALKNVKNLVWQYPDSKTTAADYVNNMVVSYSTCRSNHWVGMNKIGSDDGRLGGSAVVDLNTRVYGTDNLFVVDGSIFPGVSTTNPSSYIVTAAEHASQKILALAVPAVNKRYDQCGGLQWTGSFLCAAPYKCSFQNAYYSQCL
ncbi:cellobiose dehydrogenase [Lasiosphaeris hirsuta]|uniref:Cellobiose dehydrogenase n=1 Tax=Lasiosphaeris hirsuta TaxID=260670 RepID=A0AA40DRM6_9PEZI|nr:cellobiose dehydrogenase [Lasiosphaeris hirsuta]